MDADKKKTLYQDIRELARGVHLLCEDRLHDSISPEDIGVSGAAAEVILERMDRWIDELDQEEST